MNERAKTFRFKEWEMYNDAQSVISAVLKVLQEMPKEYRFDIGSQVVRSSFSIALNIAEGSGKSSAKELNRFLDIALGSAYETVAAVDTLRRNNLISQIAHDELEGNLAGICRQIGGFRKRIAAK